MIDFIEIEIPNPNTEVLNEKLEKYYKNLDPQSLVYRSSKGQYCNMIVYGKSDLLKIKGSIHKYFNEMTSGERENISRFEFKQLVSTLDTLADEFDFDLKNAKIKTVEIGFNLQMNKECVNYLQGIAGYLGRNGVTFKMSTLIYNNAPFKRSAIGNGIERIIYDKSKDWNTPPNMINRANKMLRVELRIKSYSPIKDLPKTAADLLDLKKLQILSKYIQEFVMSLIISEKLELDRISPNATPNKIIKHLLLSEMDLQMISTILENSQLPANQKRATFKCLREYIKNSSIRKLGIDESLKREIIQSLQDEISYFFKHT